MKTYIIAEAGVNHNGNIKMAFELIEKAKYAGADCIKFQTFKADKLVTKKSPKALYQKKVTDPKESQYEMLKKLELTYSEFKEVFDYCKSIQIDFLSTPYNFDDVDFLESLGVNTFKIASGQLTEIPFLQYVAKKKKRMIISSGMSNLSDIFKSVLAVKEAGNNDIIILQCTTNYPSLIEDSNLLAMNTIKIACGVRVGYSDHVRGNLACYASVALGAEVIEKHFTLDKNLPGPDHSSSLNPIEFKELVNGIRDVELSLGSSIKSISKNESKNINGMKRSLVASRKMIKGEKINLEDIQFKRPANGLEINQMPFIIGKKTSKTILLDEPYKWDNIEW